MKASVSKAIIEDIRKRGYVLANGVYWPPDSPEAIAAIRKPKKKQSRSNRLKTGWIDDTLNIRNQQNIVDEFTQLAKAELDLTVWPEFYFLADRGFRFDYAIPLDANSNIVKIAIECDGGIWAKGKSGHSSGKGIARDMEKGSLAAVNGWKLIRRTPTQLCTTETLELIRQALRIL